MEIRVSVDTLKKERLTNKIENCGKTMKNSFLCWI